MYQLHLENIASENVVSLNSKLKSKIFARPFMAMWRMILGAVVKKTHYNNSDEVYAMVEEEHRMEREQ